MCESGASDEDIESCIVNQTVLVTSLCDVMVALEI